MWVLKLLGSLLVICGAWCFGQLGIYEYRQRLWILREFAQSLRLFGQYTEIYHLPLEIVCQKISMQFKSPISDFYLDMSKGFQQQRERCGKEIWNRCMEIHGFLNFREGLKHIRYMGDFLGIQDLKMQIKALERYADLLEQTAESMEKSQSEKEKLYRTFSVALGCMVAILFL